MAARAFCLTPTSQRRRQQGRGRKLQGAPQPQNPRRRGRPGRGNPEHVLLLALFAGLETRKASVVLCGGRDFGERAPHHSGDGRAEVGRRKVEGHGEDPAVAPPSLTLRLVVLFLLLLLLAVAIAAVSFFFFFFVPGLEDVVDRNRDPCLFF